MGGLAQLQRYYKGKGVHDSSGCSLRILQSVPAGSVFAMQQPEAILVRGKTKSARFVETRLSLYETNCL
jgi:hypothetical protein